MKHATLLWLGAWEDTETLVIVVASSEDPGSRSGG